MWIYVYGGETGQVNGELAQRITGESMGVKVPEVMDYTNFTPIDTNEEASITPDDTLVERNQIGEPMDKMYFYYMNLYPIVEIPSTGELVVWNSYIGNVADRRGMLYQSYTKAETTALYNQVTSQGYNFVGWQVKVKFRFDFILAHSWTLSIDGGQSVTDNVPQPSNPYQTYIYTYNSFFGSDPTQLYNTSFKGSVYYMDKYDGNRGKDRAFSAITAFNALN